MDVFTLIFNMTGIVVWLFPPIRQIHTKFFLFFLFYGIADLSGLFFGTFVGSGSNHVIYMIASISAFLSLLEKKSTIFYISLYSLLILPISITFIVTQEILISILTLLISHLLITGVLLKNLLDDFFKSQVFSIFIGVLIFYEFTTITKLATLLTGFTNNYLYFNTTTAIQIIIGLFFTFYRYDNKRFILQLK